MNHPILRAKAFLSLIGCTLIAGCSLQVPSESDVFEKNSAAGQTAGGNTSTNLGGASTAGNSAQIGGTTPAIGGASFGGAGGTTDNESGGVVGTDTSAGASSVGGGGTSATSSGTSAVGGSGGGGGSTAQPTGGIGAGGSVNGGSSPLGGATATGGAITVGGATSATGGRSTTTVGGSSSGVTGGASTTGTPTTGGDATGGAATSGTTTGGAATGGDATGGAATGGTATGGAATGGSPTGGAATGGSPTGGAPTGGAPPQVILQYKFDEGSGTTAVDSTPNHYDGTLANVTWSLTGRNGAAVNFANAASQITVPSNLLGTSQSLTASAWVNLTTNTAENRLFYFGTEDGTSYFTLTFNNSATTAGISVRFKSPTGTEQVLTTPTQIPTGVWKHVTASISNVGAALYVDGKIVAQDRTLVMDPTTLGTPMTNLVGASPTAGQNFQGLIDEFYVYDGVLPLSDIRVLAAPKADYSMYHLDEGTGTATADTSTRHRDGTLVGGATWIPSPFGTGVLLANTPSVAPAQQYVDLADGLVSDCGLNLTVAGWFNFTSNTTEAPLFEFGKDTANFVNITTYVGSSYSQAVFSFNLNNIGAPHVARARPYNGWLMGKWTHIAVVRSSDGKPLALYQDGFKAVTGTTNTGALLTAWGTTTLNALGKATSDTVPGFDGAIDEVLVSCRAYTDDEIKQLAYLPPN